MNASEREKEAIAEAHKFLHWMEACHGFIPYGFHGDVKRLLLAFVDRVAPLPELSKPGKSEGGEG